MMTAPAANAAGAVFVSREPVTRPAAQTFLLHAVLVGLDHLLDHLAADGAGLAGGQVAVIALLQVDADFP